MQKWVLETPCLLVNYDILQSNIKYMQRKADINQVNLRPHTKTHRTPALAKLQLVAGARGITAAKVGEAEVMVDNGIRDIFIANQIVGESKLRRLRQLARRASIRVGVDCEDHVHALSQAFAGEKPISVLIEIEVGEERTGLRPGPQVVELAQLIARLPNVELEGVYSHEGHTYSASSPAKCRELFAKAQQDTLKAAQMIKEAGFAVNTVSIGATPSLLLADPLPGITEIRPGTYILLDAAQANLLGDYTRCAATVLSTVISKPTPDRAVLDAGVKALTSSVRQRGICQTPGFGLVKDHGVWLKRLYDEHGIISDEKTVRRLAIGDKVEVIPNHICPTCNLYDKLYLVRGDEVLQELPIACRGKSQ